MKYTNRLKGLIEAIADIEHDIETNKSQILYHKNNLIDQNGEVVPYHEHEIEKYKSSINILETALEYIKELDIRRIHEFEEMDNQTILFEE